MQKAKHPFGDDATYDSDVTVSFQLLSDDVPKGSDESSNNMGKKGASTTIKQGPPRPPPT